MKSLFIALGMAAVLFMYGYIASVTGHDHARHAGEMEGRREVILEKNTEAMDQGEHDHSHH